MRTKIQFSSFILLVLFFACDRPDCKNTNPVFDTNAPDTQEYKLELARQLESIDRNRLTYWFFRYVESAGEEQLYFHIQGDGLCAQMVLSVEQWEKLKVLREKKGVSFRGAEFTNLQFDIRQDSLKTEFILKDFNRIID